MPPFNVLGPVSRPAAVTLIQAALAAGEARFARQAALAWLTAYPGDLLMGLFHAEALLQEAQRPAPISRPRSGFDRPIAILQALCQTDPECLPAQALLARTLLRMRRGAPTPASPVPPQGRLGSGSEETGSGVKGLNESCSGALSLDVPTLRRADIDTFGDVLALTGRSQPGMPLPEWSDGLRQARQAMARLIGPHGGQAIRKQVHALGDEGQHLKERAERHLHAVLLANPTTPLAAVTHLQWEVQRDLPFLAVRSLANVYHVRWPGCVQFILLLANAWMDSGEQERAVALLHQAVTLDVTGQVARRLWGESHPYRSLWPDRLEAPILQDLPVPAAVAAALGWNKLPTGSASRPAAGQESALPGLAVPSPAVEVKAAPVSLPQKTGPETPVNIQSELDNRVDPARRLPGGPEEELARLAARLHQPQLGRADGRFPVYVILTTRRGLQAQYGPEAAGLIEAAMLGLVEAVRQPRAWRAPTVHGWEALLFYADEGLALPASGPRPAASGQPARYTDPWSLKLALADLDAALGRKGEMIGALLIAGGPEVVPFHRLPNPVEDADVDVPSDNPYATRDENYFIPEWPVGRLPGGKGSDPGLLLGSLASITARHQEQARPKPWYTRGWEALQEGWLVPSRRVRPSLGYTAAVWQEASRSVFRPVGKGRSLLVSPPLHVAESGACPATPASGSASSNQPENGTARRNGRNGGAGTLPLPPARLGYFNLHGLPDAAEWYGQRDPAGPPDEPDYPIALRPQDIEPQHPSQNGEQAGPNGHNGRRASPAPQVVFTEACYGGHILGKGIEEALALKFLASGCQAVAGATCTAYGAIADPLTAADLLGYAFWKSLEQGLPAGEALRRAKIHLAREMHRRQGYLDGEDQKTLISFVLYGDPLAQPLRGRRVPKSLLRPLAPPAQVKTVCDRDAGGEETRPVPPEVLRYVKNVVAQYLPGMAGAQVRLSQEHASCPGGSHQCPTSQLGAKARPARAPHRQVVTLQKAVPAGPAGETARMHQHYARLTLDENGRLVKLVVSR